MATIQTNKAEDAPTKKNGRTRIPLREYIRFRRAKDKEDVDFLNYHLMERELSIERKIARKLQKDGVLWAGNGFEMFLEACKRRMADPKWHRVIEHSDNVRRYAYCIALTHEKQKARQGEAIDDILVEVVANVAGYHDIGKTLTAAYLINREDGTWFGIGRGQRIDFRKELDVLRHSHVEAGMELLEIYRNFMNERVYQLAKWAIGGHHIAYDGEGTASAPSYPKTMDGINVKEHMSGRNLPAIARIIRAADVYSAIMENRFYLAESERVVTKVVNMEPDDTALGLLITVAGTDVDPHMVKCLLVGKYKVMPDVAEAVVDDLACKERACLRERGGDIRFSLKEVIPKPRFLDIVTGRRNTDWGVMFSMQDYAPGVA